MDKQYLRNSLSNVEDYARDIRRSMASRDTAVVPGDIVKLANAVVRLTQLVREGIVQ